MRAAFYIAWSFLLLMLAAFVFLFVRVLFLYRVFPFLRSFSASTRGFYSASSFLLLMLAAFGVAIPSLINPPSGAQAQGLKSRPRRHARRRAPEHPRLRLARPLPTAHNTCAACNVQGVANIDPPNIDPPTRGLNPTGPSRPRVDRSVGMWFQAYVNHSNERYLAHYLVCATCLRVLHERGYSVW